MAGSTPEIKSQQIALAYQSGQAAFERGQYREAVESLLRANALGNRNSPLGGEIQVWLVTAYEAAGQRQEALALCRQLCAHPDRTTRKQSKRLLYILEAPKLQLHPEWLTQIPDLSQVSERNLVQPIGSRSTTKAKSSWQVASSDPIDLSQVTTQDNGFIWAALGMTALLLGGLVWFS